jgi:uncharacterized protein YacL
MKTPFSKLLMAVSWERVAAGILGVALLVSLSVDYDPDTGVTMTTVSTTALVVAAVMCLVGVGIVGVEALWQDWTETATARGPLAISVIGGLGLVFATLV